jgi:hypothetical protein
MSYWGLYCPQCGAWFRQVSGLLVFYPAPEISNADIKALQSEYPRIPLHRYQVQEFGKEERQSTDRLPENELCPELKYQKQYLKT